MFQNKRPSFLLYKSFYSPVKHLKDDELGLLFRALFDYQDGLEIKDLSPQVGMAFAFFKNQFDLDEQKYQTVLERNKSNGSKGGRPKKEETQANLENPVGFYEPRKGEKEKETEKETEKEKEIKKEKEDKNILSESQFESFWESYIPVKTNNGFVKKGLKEKSKIAFLKALKKTSFEKIMAALQSYLNYCQQNNRFTKNAASWLNEGDFEITDETCIIAQNNFEKPLSADERRRKTNANSTEGFLNKYRDNDA